MCGGRDDVRGVANLRFDFGRHGTQIGAGHNHVAEHVARNVECFQNRTVPLLGTRVHQARCGSVGIFVGLGAGKQEGQVIGNHQERLRVGNLLRMLTLQGQQLVDGVERLALNAGTAIHRIRCHDGIGHGVHAVGALIAIRHGIAQHLVVFA